MPFIARDPVPGMDADPPAGQCQGIGRGVVEDGDGPTPVRLGQRIHPRLGDAAHIGTHVGVVVRRQGPTQLLEAPFAERAARGGPRIGCRARPPRAGRQEKGAQRIGASGLHGVTSAALGLPGIVGDPVPQTTKQPPPEAGGFALRTESPDKRRLNDASRAGDRSNPLHLAASVGSVRTTAAPHPHSQPSMRSARAWRWSSRP